MAEYPKRFVKGDSVRTSHNVRQDVQFRFAGYKQADMDIKPTNEEPPASHVERVNALLGRTDEVPVLSETEMAKLPEVKDAEVVDLTDDSTKPTEAELKSNVAAKAADPKAYLASQSNTGGGENSADARNARKR